MEAKALPVRAATVREEGESLSVTSAILPETDLTEWMRESDSW
jgi:hypothetical protein